MSDNTTNQGTPGDFASLVKEDTFKIPQVGDTIEGTVLASSKAEVRLDIGGRLVGVVRGRELYFEAGEYSGLKPGDTVEATVMDVENENGELELSFRHAGEEKTWVDLEEIFAQKKNIVVRINAANRGGLLVSYAQIPAFLPVSQLSPENYPRVSGGDKTKILEKLKSLVGTETEAKIITFDRKEGKLVVSEKDAWQEKQKDVISQFKIGDTVEGRIIAVTSFGVFVNFGGNLEGLIHISELAWQRIEDPSEVYKVGDDISAQIISIEGAKIFLSAKRLLADPWEGVEKKYAVGQNVQGTILKVNPFGLFVELDPDIHGLAHISQLGLPTGDKIEDTYKPGTVLEFSIISLDATEHRLGLAIPGKAKDKKTSKSKKSKDKDKEEKEVKKEKKEKTEKAGEETGEEKEEIESKEEEKAE